MAGDGAGFFILWYCHVSFVDDAVKDDVILALEACIGRFSRGFSGVLEADPPPPRFPSTFSDCLYAGAVRFFPLGVRGSGFGGSAGEDSCFLLVAAAASGTGQSGCLPLVNDDSTLLLLLMFSSCTVLADGFCANMRTGDLAFVAIPNYLPLAPTSSLFSDPPFRTHAQCIY